MTDSSLDLGEMLKRVSQDYGAKAPPPPPPAPPVVSNLWYKDKMIKLDGWVFKSCRFDGCRLIVSSPYFVLEECYIDSSSTIEFEGSIVNVVQLSNFDKASYLNNDRFSPVMNGDGTISIGV